MNFIQNQSQGSLHERFIISHGSEDALVKQGAIWQVWGSQWLNIYISQPVWDICQALISWVSPSCCNPSSAAHLLLETKAHPCPELQPEPARVQRVWLEQQQWETSGMETGRGRSEPSPAQSRNMFTCLENKCGFLLTHRRGSPGLHATNPHF